MESPERVGSAFVGRERELGFLEAELSAAFAGRGRLVTVVGDAGIGKTTAVEEFVARAAIPPGRVTWGRCPEQPGAPAFWPWVQAFRGYATACQAGTLDTDFRALAPQLVQAIPALRERLEIDALPSADS